jgi:hypothetical protein
LLDGEEEAEREEDEVVVLVGVERVEHRLEEGPALQREVVATYVGGNKESRVTR